jgi:hypothetical protein
MVSFVYDEDGFLIKGAIDQLVNELQVSRYAIYNYLEDLKAKKKKLAKYFMQLFVNKLTQISALTF